MAARPHRASPPTPSPARFCGGAAPRHRPDEVKDDDDTVGAAPFGDALILFFFH